MVRLVCLFALVVACTKSSETSHPARKIVPPADATTIASPPDAAAVVDAPVAVAVDASVPPDAAPVAGPPVLTSCPKTFAIASAGTCALASADALSCTYPDGHCSCGELRPCSGWAGAYEEARKHPRAAWGCTPRVRSDGCLGDPPKLGSRCGHDGKECSYGSCGGQVLVCRTGVWAISRQIPPPP
ncbi:MAG: hypothetical protein ABI591_03650 [Kofleriaceae bacterium]